MKKNLKLKRTLLLTPISVIILSLVTMPIVYAATLTTPPVVSTPTKTITTSKTPTLSATTQQQHVANIIIKGNDEITRRLSSLGNLSSLINSTTKLTASDKSYLSNEVITETSGLNSLKAQLDADTTLSVAIANAGSIFSEYRVYALVLPKVWLVKTADIEQNTESQLSAIAQKLQTRLTQNTSTITNLSTLQADLANMNSEISAAQVISSSIETNALQLQPSDYDSNHAVLNGDSSQLKTAHQDNVKAYSDAKTIISALKS